MKLTQYICLIIFGLIFPGLTFAQTSIQTADQILKQASQQATIEKKKVLIVFTASWCINCIKLEKKVLDDSLAANYFHDNFVIRYFVVNEKNVNKYLETPGANEKLVKYKNGISTGIPFFVVLNKKGKLLADSYFRPDKEGKKKNIGCPITPEEVDRFIEILKHVSRITPEQIEAVKKACNNAKVL